MNIIISLFCRDTAILILKLHVGIDGLSTHRTLIRPLSNPILNAARVVEMSPSTIQFGYYIIGSKTCHADDTLILVTYRSKQIF